MNLAPGLASTSSAIPGIATTAISPELVTSHTPNATSSPLDPGLLDRQTTGKADLALGPDDKTTGDVRASFVETSTFAPQALPLLALTPPTVSKALMRAYPHLLGLNRVLLILTWTNEDQWVNIVVVLLYALIVQYFEPIIIWAGHLVAVGVVSSCAYCYRQIEADAASKPTLDDVVHALTQTSIKMLVLLGPVASLGLGPQDVRRILFTTIFLTPIYLVASLWVISPRTLILWTGIHILTYHSSYMYVTRRVIWRVNAVRLFCFYLAGLDYSEARHTMLFALALAKVQATAGGSNGRGKPAQFTYAIYENQRRWLGIGWTNNLFSYERSPWTDEFLNESLTPQEFKLPPSQDNALWRWVDKTWRIDLTNDGALTLLSLKRSRTTANPGPEEAFIYTDNVWKKPLTEDSFSKYTRRRRWTRTAELVFDEESPFALKTTAASGNVATELPVPKESSGYSVGKTQPIRRNLRFADDESLANSTKASREDTLDFSIVPKGLELADSAQ